MQPYRTLSKTYDLKNLHRRENASFNVFTRHRLICCLNFGSFVDAFFHSCLSQFFCNDEIFSIHCSGGTLIGRINRKVHLL